MSRKVTSFISLVLLIAGSVAQTFATGLKGDLNRDNEQPLAGASGRVIQPSTISVSRLGVPGQARRMYERAAKAFRTHRYAQARQSLTEALQQCPAFPEALILLGYVQLELNETQSAEQSLRAAVQSDPTYGLAYLILSYLYNMEGRFDDALPMAQHAAALMPDRWVVRYEMARSFIGKHQYELALNTIEAALPHHRGTLLHVAKAHALVGLGRYPEAIAELQSYLRYKPTAEGTQEAQRLMDRIQSGLHE